jgi:hypothetical protein
MDLGNMLPPPTHACAHNIYQVDPHSLQHSHGTKVYLYTHTYTYIHTHTHTYMYIRTHSTFPRHDGALI